MGELSSQSAKSIERYVADQQSFRKATAGVSAVVMLAGLLQLENSNFEDVPRMMFNALSRDAYRLAPTESAEELQFRRCYLLQYGIGSPSIQFLASETNR